MKATILVTVSAVMLFLISNPLSQTKSSKEETNSLKGGKWAASFLIGTQVSPDNTGSLSLAIKSQISGVFGVRLGVTTYLVSKEGNNIYEGRTSPLKESNTNASIFLNFLFYTNPAKPFSFFAGIGPVYQYSEQNSEYLGSGYPYGGSSFTSERGNSFGGFAVLGAEWFPHPRFSITGEYNLSYTLGNYNRTNTFVYNQPSGNNYEVTVTDTDTKTFNFNIVKVGFSAYF